MAVVSVLPVGPMQNLSYLLMCEETKAAAIVDPAWEEDTLEQALHKAGAKLELLLCTHGHGDHINLVDYFLRRYPDVKAVHHEKERIGAPGGRSLAVQDGQTCRLGSIDIKCMHTPGHTPGSVTYLAGDYGFFGDTLFAGHSCGRVDLYTRGPEDMVKSLVRLRELPDTLTVCSGHHYGPKQLSTMGEEKRVNPALSCDAIEDLFQHKRSLHRR